MKYLETPDIPEYVERELQRLHAILMHFGMETTEGKWAMGLIDGIHSNHMRPKIFSPIQNFETPELFELSGRA